MEQHNNDDMKKELAQYRMETAKDDLRAAKILLDAGEYKAANNRAYYAIFHAINAVHATGNVLVNWWKSIYWNIRMNLNYEDIQYENIQEKIHAIAL